MAKFEIIIKDLETGEELVHSKAATEAIEGMEKGMVEYLVKGIGERLGEVKFE